MSRLFGSTKSRFLKRCYVLFPTGVYMCISRKRICSNDDEGENVRAESSYAKMKVKMKKYEFELEQLRMELLETKRPKVEVDLVLDKVGIEQQVPEIRKRGSSKEGQTSYSKLKVKWISSQEELAHIHIVLRESQRMKSEFEAGMNAVGLDLVKVRMELQETQRNEGELIAALDSVRT